MSKIGKAETMDISQIEKLSETAWRIPAVEPMRVPAVIYGGESLVRDMDEKVSEQLKNVAALPGIVRAAYAMPDAHWGYGFPVGGVAAFDADEGGVVSAGGVAEIFDEEAAAAFGLRKGECVVSIHCGSRGLGHQIGTEFMREMAAAAETSGWPLPDRELAYASIKSDSASAIWARCVAPSTARSPIARSSDIRPGVFARSFSSTQSFPLLFDVSHNTCKVEPHMAEFVSFTFTGKEPPAPSGRVIGAYPKT